MFFSLTYNRYIMEFDYSYKTPAETLDWVMQLKKDKGYRIPAIAQFIGQVDGAAPFLADKDKARLCQEAAELLLREKAPDFSTARGYINLAIRNRIHAGSLAVDYRVLADIERRAGNLDEARHAVRRSITYGQEKKSEAMVAMSYKVLAEIEHDGGNYDAAREAIEYTIACDSHSKHQRAQSGNYRLLAQIELGAGNPDAAREAIQRTIAIHEKEENTRSLATDYRILTHIELLAGNIDKARESTKNAIVLHRRHNNGDSLAIEHIELCRVELLAGNPDEARKALNFTITHNKGNTKVALTSEARIYDLLSQVKYQADNIEEAKEAIYQAIALNTNLRNETSLAANHQFLARIEVRAGFPQKAKESLQYAINVHSGQKNKDALAVDHQLLAAAGLLDSNLEEARGAIYQAIAMHTNPRNNDGLEIDYELLAKIQLQAANFSEAKEAIQNKIELSGKSRSDSTLIMDYQLLAQIEYKAGNFAASEEAIEKAVQRIDGQDVLTKACVYAAYHAASIRKVEDSPVKTDAMWDKVSDIAKKGLEYAELAYTEDQSEQAVKAYLIAVRHYAKTIDRMADHTGNTDAIAAAIQLCSDTLKEFSSSSKYAQKQYLDLWRQRTYLENFSATTIRESDPSDNLSELIEPYLPGINSTSYATAKARHLSSEVLPLPIPQQNLPHLHRGKNILQKKETNLEEGEIEEFFSYPQPATRVSGVKRPERELESYPEKRGRRSSYDNVSYYGPSSSSGSGYRSQHASSLHDYHSSQYNSRNRNNDRSR